MKIVALLSFLLLSLFISCKQRGKHTAVLKDVPMADAKHFIDSIRHKIQLDAGENFTARPILKKNEYYYDERNFRDSLGNLKEYSIIERWDTGTVFTNYFYYKSQLINVSKRITTSHIYQTSNYYFRNDSLFDSYIEGQLTFMLIDTLLSRSFQYSSIKGDVGDTLYRKYFGKKYYPPDSEITHVQ